MKLTEQDREEIVELYQGGMSLREIGGKYGVTGMTIMNVLKKAEVPRRPVGVKARKNPTGNNTTYVRGYYQKQIRDTGTDAETAEDMERLINFLTHDLGGFGYNREFGEALLERIISSTDKKVTWRIFDHELSTMMTEEYYMLRDNEVKAMAAGMQWIQKHKNWPKGTSFADILIPATLIGIGIGLKTAEDAGLKRAMSVSYK